MNNIQLYYINKRMIQSKKTNDDPKDSSDSEQQRKILMALVGEFQHQDKKQNKVQVKYDPVMGISQLFQVVNLHEPLVEKKQQGGIFQSVKNFIKSCTSSCKSDKLVQKPFSIRSVLFNALKVEEFDWLQRHYSRYKPQQLEQLKQQYLLKMKKSLSKIRFQIQNQKIHKEAKQSSINCIINLQKLYDSIQSHPKKKFQLKLIWEKDYMFIIMISAYHQFSKGNYTTYKRAKLKNLFKLLEIQSTSFNNSIQVLRFLENKDPLLSKLQQISQLDLNLQVVKSMDQYLKKHSQNEEMKTRIALVKVSESFKRRRVINLLISGFLSQDVDKKQQWNQLLACMPDSEVYGLQWQSNTINRLVKFLALSIKDVILGKDLQNLITKDNPFIPAYEVAIRAGQMLAYAVYKIFPFQFINIISYSLGSQLIRAFLQKLIELNGAVNVNKVIMMGGVSDVTDFEKTLQKTQQTITVLNIRTKHDSVLKYILKRAKPTVKPIGLNDISQNIQNHLIKNIQVSNKIKGHFSFMTNFGTIAQLLKLNEE